MKVTFFLGRIHHAHKLLDVAASLREEGVDIDFLIADNSINIDPTVKYLPEFGITSFHHVRDYVDKAADATIDWKHFNTELFKYFPPFWIISAYAEAAECIVGFQGYLAREKPDAVFALHENNFWVRILFYLAQERGVTTYSLQEGIILEKEEKVLKKYSTGTDYTNVLFSWSGHDKDFYSDPSKIVPVGPSHMGAWITLGKDEARRGDLKTAIRESVGMRDKRLVVFAPPRLDLYAGDFVRAAHAIAKWAMARRIGVVIKLHPFQDSVNEIKNIMSRYTHVKVIDDSNSLPFVLAADVLITQTSTIAVEAAILGVPVVELDMDYIGLDQTINQHGGATLIEGTNIDGILHAMDDDVGKEFVDWYFPLADGKSTERIVDYVMAELWAK